MGNRKATIAQNRRLEAIREGLRPTPNLTSWWSTPGSTCPRSPSRSRGAGRRPRRARDDRRAARDARGPGGARRCRVGHEADRGEAMTGLELVWALVVVALIAAGVLSAWRDRQARRPRWGRGAGPRESMTVSSTCS